MYYEEKVKDILDDESLSKEEKIKRINEYFDKQYEEINDELRNYLIKIWGGFALEVGSAAIPGAGVGKLGTKVGQKLLTKFLGRKISSGLGTGALGGATIGAGDALINDRSGLEFLGETVLGGVAGGTLSGIAAYAEKFLRGVKLKSYGNPDELYDDIWRKYKKDMQKYYQDYIQKRTIKKDGIVDFTGRAVQEQMTHNIKQGQNYPGLVSDIKNAEKLFDAPNLKTNEKPFVDHYEIYHGKYGYHHIEVLKDGKRRYYVTKDTLDGTHRNPPGSKKSATDITVDTPQQAHNPVYNEVYPPRALVEASDKIIKDFPENVNSSDGSTMLKGHVEVNVPKEETLSDIEQGQPTGYAAKISEKAQADGQKDDDNLPTWEKPLAGYEEPNVYLKNGKYTFDGELSDEEISKMNIREKMEYYTKYLKHYYIKRLKTLAREQEQRDMLEIIREQEIQRQKEFEEEYWSPEEIREEVEEYLSRVFDSVARDMGF
jgi:hypothetical protein